MRFQITFEGEGFIFLLEGAVKLDPPRTEFGRMRTTVLVMCEESLFEIPSESDVSLVRLIYTSDDINVEHSPAPFCFAQLPCFAAVGSFAGHASPTPKVACFAVLIKFPTWLATRSPQRRSVEAAGVEPASPANKPAATTCLVRNIFSAVR